MRPCSRPTHALCRYLLHHGHLTAAPQTVSLPAAGTQDSASPLGVQVPGTANRLHTPAATHTLYQGAARLPWEPVDVPYDGGYLATNKRAQEVLQLKHELTTVQAHAHLRQAANLPYGDAVYQEWLARTSEEQRKALSDRLAVAVPIVSRWQNLRVVLLGPNGVLDLDMERHLFGVVATGLSLCYVDVQGRTCFVMDSNKGCQKLLNWLGFYGLDDRLVAYRWQGVPEIPKGLSRQERLDAFQGRLHRYVVRF
ncbi:hypothetical protein WJX72_007855 [[Myrmecia] bisecta]|uniref:Uncharacterized protein n=1 Tax=[Myrmecia] bisecta TaxID=41462 RepID=A0AAW1P2V5_9CHLO